MMLGMLSLHEHKRHLRLKLLLLSYQNHPSHQGQRWTMI